MFLLCSTDHCVDDSRRSSIEELQKTLPRSMVFSSHQISLSNTVGQGKHQDAINSVLENLVCNILYCVGESGLVYRAYLSSGGETQVVAVKAGKGRHCYSVRFITTIVSTV